MTPRGANVESKPRVQLRLHPRLRGLWPPEPGGGFAPGAEFPIGGEDVLEHVFYYAPVGQAKADVSLKTSYKGHHHTRDLLLDDPDFAQSLTSRLRKETGRTIAELGELELEF